MMQCIWWARQKYQDTSGPNNAACNFWHIINNNNNNFRYFTPLEQHEALRCGRLLQILTTWYYVRCADTAKYAGPRRFRGFIYGSEGRDWTLGYAWDPSISPCQRSSEKRGGVFNTGENGRGPRTVRFKQIITCRRTRKYHKHKGARSHGYKWRWLTLPWINVLK